MSPPATLYHGISQLVLPHPDEGSALSPIDVVEDGALLLENAPLQRFRRIALLDGYDPLQDDRSVIVFIIHKVNGTAGQFAAIFDDRLMNPHPIKALA